MKRICSIIIIIIMSVRVSLPLLCYTMNYEYIITHLCESRNQPNNQCKGKCYLKKELSKTNKEQGKEAHKIEVTPLDTFVHPFNEGECPPLLADFHSHQTKIFGKQAFYTSPYRAAIFHPPIV